jgi:putative salt-induced outer membrane protein YdiY
MIRTLSLFVLSSSVATAAINVEEIRPAQDEDGVNAEVELGGTYKTGNLEYAQLATSAGAAYQSGPHMAFLISSYTYAGKISGTDLDSDLSLLDEDARYWNKGSAHLRYNYSFSNSMAVELFTQVEFNEFLRLDLRTLGGVGIRSLLAATDTTTAYVGAGYMYEVESYNPSSVAEEDLASTANRATTYISLETNPTEANSGTLTAYFQPNISDFSDYRAIVNAELEHKLSDNFALNISFSMRMDSAPPEVTAGNTHIRPVDTVSSTSFSYEF